MYKFLSLLFEKKYRLKLHFLYFPIVTTVLAMLLVPLKVTVDGRLYLSSARALFSDKMSSHYYWVREPIYPLFLRIIKVIFGSSDLGLIFIQGAMLGTSIVFCLYAFSLLLKIERVNLVFLVLIYFFIINPFILGMTGLVLQQVIFTFYLSSASLILAVTYKHGFKLLIFIFTIFIFFISVLTSVSFLIIFIPILLTYFYLIAFYENLSLRNSSYKSIQILKKGFLVVIGTALIYAAGFVTLRFWSIFKNANSQKSTLPTELFTPEQINQTIIEATTTLSLYSMLIEQSQRYIKNFFSLFHLTKSEAFNFYELSIYTNFQFEPGWLCGAYDEFEEKPYSSYGLGYFTGNCRSVSLNSLIQPHLSFFEFFYTLLMILILSATLVLLLTKKRYLTIALVPQFAFIFAYTLADAGLDRYGYSIFSIAFGLLVLINLVNLKSENEVKLKT